MYNSRSAIYHVNVFTGLRYDLRPLTHLQVSNDSLTTWRPAGKLKGPRWDECIVGEWQRDISSLSRSTDLNSGHTRHTRGRTGSQQPGQREATIGELADAGLFKNGLRFEWGNLKKGITQQRSHPHLWDKQKTIVIRQDRNKRERWWTEHQTHA